MSSKRIYDDHVEIQKFHKRLIRAIRAGDKKEDVIKQCDHALVSLKKHIEFENDLMTRSGFNKEKCKRHTDHHKLIVSLLTNECRRLAEGGEVIDFMIDVYDEIMSNHAVLFDNELIQWAMKRGV